MAGEQAIALENTMPMRWPSGEVEQLIERRPGLGLAFLKLMAQRELQLAERLESLSLDTMPVRLAKALIRLSERLGIPGADGTVTMRAFTHEFLAQYIGSSRELVNFSINDFRRQDLVKYSRMETTIRLDALWDCIRMNR